MHSILLASHIQQGDLTFTHIVSWSPRQAQSPCAADRAPRSFLCPLRGERRRGLFDTGALSLSLLSTSPRIPPSLPCPFRRVHRKVKTACLPSPSDSFPLAKHPTRPPASLQRRGFILLYGRVRCTTDALADRSIFSAGSSVDGRSGCCCKHCCKEHWSLDAS